MTWSNLVVWNLQIALLVAVAALAAALVRLGDARVRLLYWQALLAVCLLLPLVQPWQREVMVVPSTPPQAVAVTPAAPGPEPAPAPRWSAGDAAAAALAAGLLLRAAWFGLGLLRLARYRRGARPLDPVPAPVAALQRQLCVFPEIRLSGDVAGPVTFGFRDPVVLFPERFTELDPEVQAAVACHELLHVKRRDWLFTAAEEAVRAVFWFHPAIWWVLGQIQLAREQVVDRETVGVTCARERYIDALLTVSGARRQLDLAPAPLFLRRRHLTARVSAIVKEVEMSRRRLIGSIAVCFTVLFAAGWLISGSLPLKAALQVVADAPGITVTGAEQLIHRSPVRYPAEALAARVEGTVVVDAQLNKDGTVADATVLSGPVELRRAALESVLAWHFSRDAGSRVQVSIRFEVPEGQAPPGPATGVTVSPAPPPPGSQTTLMRLHIEGLSPAAAEELRARLPIREGQALDPETMQRVTKAVKKFDEHLMVSFGQAVMDSQVGSAIRIRPATAFPPDFTLAKIVIEGLSPQAAEELRARLPVSEGGKLDAEIMRRVVGTMREYDRHLNAMVRAEAEGMVLRIGVGGVAPPRPPLPVPPDGVRRVRVGAYVQAAKLVQNPAPVYPPLARQARISGLVRLDVLVGADGTVTNVTAITGHPLLVPAAMEAVRQYRYSQTLLNGVPVEVVTTVEVPFNYPPPE